MKKNKLFAMAMAVTMTAGTFAGPLSAMASEIGSGNQQSGSTKVTVTKETEKPNTPTYELVVPKDLSVTKAGFTESGAVKVMTDDPANFTGEVEVTMKSENGNVFVNKNDATSKLKYTLKKDDKATVDLKYMIFMSDTASSWAEDNCILAKVGDTGATFGVNIQESDWNAASDGTYEDTIVFTAQYFGN